MVDTAEALAKSKQSAPENDTYTTDPSEVDNGLTMQRKDKVFVGKLVLVINTWDKFCCHS